MSILNPRNPLKSASNSNGTVGWEDIVGRPDLSESTKLTVVKVDIEPSNWVNNQFAAFVEGISDEALQLIVPVPTKDSKNTYREFGIECDQEENALVFIAKQTPDTLINLNVYIFEVVETKPLVGDFVWWSPKMTSNNTPAPYKASTSSIYYAQSDAFHAFDGTTSTWWHESITSSGAQWIAFDFSGKQFVGGVRLYIRPSYNSVKDLPYSYHIQGSNDGETWTTIMTIVDAPDIKDVSEPREHIFSAVQYRYYRLYDLIGHAGYRSIAEIEFYVPEVYANEHS